MTVIEARRLERAASRRKEQEERGEGCGAAMQAAAGQSVTAPGEGAAHRSPPQAPAGPARGGDAREGNAAPRGLSALICALARPITGRRYRRARMRRADIPRRADE